MRVVGVWAGCNTLYTISYRIFTTLHVTVHCMNVTLLGVTVIAFLLQYVTVKVTTYVTVVYIYKYVINCYILMFIDHCNLCYVTQLRYCIALLYVPIMVLHYYSALLHVTICYRYCHRMQCYTVLHVRYNTCVSTIGRTTPTSYTGHQLSTKTSILGCNK